MTTGGEGGMVTTDDRDLWARMWSLKDHGKSWEAVYERPHPPGFRWLHEGFGTNWRLTGMQSAIGRIQLRRMAEWHAQRVGDAEAIWNACRELPGLRVPVIPPEVERAAYKCYVFVEPAALKPAGTATGSWAKSLFGVFPAVPARVPRCIWRRPSTARVGGRRSD